ncbi:hypothetical protein [Haloarchaeobius sp. DFWS5]|uniref:hypothetical protein n=1 Tax=Haloarchaeobius sp. DFWS5 TaxID=3446114 RepID=UPI003EC133FC
MPEIVRDSEAMRWHHDGQRGCGAASRLDPDEQSRYDLEWPDALNYVASDPAEFCDECDWPVE